MQSRVAAESPEGAHSPENLALLYQGLLTGIVRIQAQRQTIAEAETFRRRIKASLKEVEQAAIMAGYDGRDVAETHFAVVAFLDSVILHLNEPIRGDWERRTLQQELFGQADAGVAFFEKLDALASRRDSERLADLLEVYLLCLLLGFQGRYSGGQQAELQSVVDRLRLRIEQVRARGKQLSPSGMLAEKAAPPPQRLRTLDPVPWIALGIFIFMLLLWGAFQWNLFMLSDEVRGGLL